MSRLTAAQRRRLPRTAFALPARRAYPIEDRRHAILAKERALQQYRERNLSEREYDQVEHRAHSALRNPTRWAFDNKWGLGALVVLAGALVVHPSGLMHRLGFHQLHVANPADVWTLPDNPITLSYPAPAIGSAQRVVDAGPTVFDPQSLKDVVNGKRAHPWDRGGL